MTALRIAVVAGEESGDILGADLVEALAAQAGRPIELIGVGGPHLQALGLRSLFDPSEIALMGVTAVLARLPSLLSRIRSTATAIAAAKPDCLLIVDSPGFNLRVAKSVRALAPGIPIIKYVCPSVWAYWPSRAPAMRPHVDHVLCILPFEPDVLAKLGGPAGTYVGHRMVHDAGLRSASSAQASRGSAVRDGERTLVVLPGSRRSEVKGLIGPFGEVVSILHERGNRLKLILPTVARLAPTLTAATANWPVKPRIVEGADAKWAAFGQADAAIAASGTVSLELALAGVPFVACYKTDPIVRLLERQITVWSASLPNIIADRAVVPEFYDGAIRPQMLSRYLEALMGDEEARRAQKSGFARVEAAMAADRPAGEIAAGVVLQMLLGRRA